MFSCRCEDRFKPRERDRPKSTMATKVVLPSASDSVTVRERRRRSRVHLSCYILVRPLEPEPDYFESVFLTTNSCRDGLSFETDCACYCQRMRLLISYPYSLQAGAINRDYIGEVVRRDPLPNGRYRVAVRFLTTAKLTTPRFSNLSSSEVWNSLWQKAK